jgi:hypothetical protein
MDQLVKFWIIPRGSVALAAGAGSTLGDGVTGCPRSSAGKSGIPFK